MKFDLQKATDGFLMLLCVCLSVVNWHLLRDNNIWREAAERRTRMFEAQVGTRAPQIFGLDDRGNKVLVDFGSGAKKTVLLIFSTTCGVCDQNWPTWQQMMRDADKNSVRFVSITLFPTIPQEYIDRHRLHDFPLITELDPQNIIDYHFELVPQTVIIGSTGTIAGVWTGLLKRERLSEVRRALSM